MGLDRGRDVLGPGEGESDAVRTNGGHQRPRRGGGNPARRLTRRAAPVEGLEVHLVLSDGLVRPGQTDPIAIPGEVGTVRFAWCVGDAPRTSVDLATEILEFARQQ